MQDLFTNTFLLDGKTKQSVAGVPENGQKKNGFHYPENQFPLLGMRLNYIKI